MAYCVIISTTNSIVIDFGVYSLALAPTGIIPYERVIGKTDIVLDRRENNVIEAHVEFNEQKFRFSSDGSQGTLKVDSVNGSVPSNNLELFNLLKVMLD